MMANWTVFLQKHMYEGATKKYTITLEELQITTTTKVDSCRQAMCHVGPQELPEDSQILGSRFQFVLLHMSQSDALQEVGGFRKTSMME